MDWKFLHDYQAKHIEDFRIVCVIRPEKTFTFHPYFIGNSTAEPQIFLEFVPPEGLYAFKRQVQFNKEDKARAAENQADFNINEPSTSGSSPAKKAKLDRP